MHKAWGLKQLLNHWDLNDANIMAFGDGDNDIELLRMASHSYAMENASPALLQVADQIAPHHKDQGVLTILEDYLGLC
ncbi:HAD hydrolase family protein [Streptococcus thermophilus]